MAEETQWSTVAPADGPAERPRAPVHLAIEGSLAEDPSGSWDIVRDRTLDRRVRLRRARDASGAAAVRAEAARLVSLTHPGVPPVYDAALEDPAPWYTLRHDTSPPLMAEPSLARRVAALRLVCATVATAHSRGLWHGGLEADLLRLGPAGLYMEGWERPGPGGAAEDVAVLVGLSRSLIGEDTDSTTNDADQLALQLQRWLDGAPRRQRASARIAEAQAWFAGRHAEDDPEHHHGWAAWEAAFALDPERDEPRQALGARYRAQHNAAVWARDVETAARSLVRLAAVDRGEHRRYRRGVGTLVLSTEPAGARVWAARFRQEGVIWPLEPEIELGTTPFEGELPSGSYRLTLRRPGSADTVYPVLIPRDGVWRGEGIRLLSAAELPEGFVYVPKGPTRLGGDPRSSRPALELRELDGFLIRRHHVSLGEYVQFLRDLPLDEAWARAPREGQLGEPVPHWSDTPWVVPERDRFGNRWSADLPVFSISWDDAAACAAWAARRSERPLRLPTAWEWEKAARGVDGRYFPWGDHFDPALTHVVAGGVRSQMPSVPGAWPHDQSVYGVFDTLGNVRDLCADTPDLPRGPDEQGTRPVRGVGWTSPARDARLANLRLWRPNQAVTTYSFRWVIPLG